MLEYGLPRWLSGKETTCNGGDTGDMGFNLWLGNIPWRRKWPVLYSCLGNPMDREAWWATVCGGAKELDATDHTCMHVGIHFS